jgi:hypothetical protein
MDSSVFNIILITFAIVIVLHIIYNANLKKENMQIIENNEYSEAKYREPGSSGLDRTANPDNWYHVANKIALNDKTKKNKHKNKKVIFDDFYEGRNSDPFDGPFDGPFDDPFNAPEIEIPINKKNRKFGKFDYDEDIYTDVYGNECTKKQSDFDVKEYIRNNVLNGNNECGCVIDKSKSLFTRNEVDEYREQALQFHNKINGTSAPSEDPVDKINIIALKEGVKANGQTIADFYDNLVG